MSHDAPDDDGGSVKLTFGTLPTGVSEGATNEAVVTITDDDIPQVQASFEQSAYTVAESDDPTTTEVQENQVEIKPSPDPDRTVTIPISGTNQGFASSADYSGVPEGVTFASGETEKTFTLSATHDAIDDDGQSVKLTFGTKPAGVTPGRPTRRW